MLGDVGLAWLVGLGLGLVACGFGWFGCFLYWCLGGWWFGFYIALLAGALRLVIGCLCEFEVGFF